MAATTRDKIQAQDLILKSIDELSKVLREKGELAILDAVLAERERLAKKWGVS